jgi:hypothetical protein
MLDMPTEAEKTIDRFDIAKVARQKSQVVTDIGCVNQEVLTLVDRILEREPDAIIIIQGDHGSGFLHNWKSHEWPSDEFFERFSILNAIRLPERCRGMHYPGISPVNTFRLVFACLKGEDVEWLRDTSLLTNYDWAHPLKAWPGSSRP